MQEPREAKQSRPQFVMVLADNSGSMRGPKAEAATEGVQEMLMECQSRGPNGMDRSYYTFSLILFDQQASVHPLADKQPVRSINPDDIEILGDGGQTNITAALELALTELQQYLPTLNDHDERDCHPLPIVLLFSDGQHNVGPGPEPVAERIKQLNLDGNHVIIAVAGVEIEGSVPDEATLRRIASPECYVRCTNTRTLVNFIARVGSRGTSSMEEVQSLLSEIDV